MFHNFCFLELLSKPITLIHVSFSNTKQNCSYLQPSEWGNTARTGLLPMAESTQITAKLLCWAWPRSWHTMVLSFQCPTSMSLTCPCTLEQICSISPISKCSIATQRWLVSHCNSLTHGIWHRKATNSREVGAVQPEGKYLEIPSWDLTTTVRFTIDIARLSHHPSYCFVIS